MDTTSLGLTAATAIDKALLLEEGETITIPCPSYDSMESLRSQLYKRKKTLAKAYRKMADSIYITRETNKHGWFIHLTKQHRVTGAFITGKDGSIRPFFDEKDLDTATFGDETEDQRIMRLMREDGKTEEEIAEYFAEKGEQDFDAAASKIEESQGLTSQDDDLELDVSKKRQ